MNGRIVQWLSLGLALVAAIGSLTMVYFRAERNWPIGPVWPYVDTAHNHWFYRTMSHLPNEQARMAIWGWAAHAWIYTGTVPATRESSTEFAWRDWGQDGYYRKRFMTSLADNPPDYFMVAVGPSHFMFNDRNTYGTQTLPRLDEFLGKHYEPVLDDGDTALLIRQDVYARCCGPAQVNIAPRHATQTGWIRAADGSNTPVPVWDLSTRTRADAIVVPVRFGPDASSPDAKVSLFNGNNVKECDVMPPPGPEGVAICIFERPQGRHWQLVARSGAKPDTWIEVGKPLVVANGNPP